MVICLQRVAFGPADTTGLTKHRVDLSNTASTTYFPHPQPPKLLGYANYCVDHCDLNIVHVDGSGNCEIPEE